MHTRRSRVEDVSLRRSTLDEALLHPAGHPPKEEERRDTAPALPADEGAPVTAAPQVLAHRLRAVNRLAEDVGVAGVL